MKTEINHIKTNEKKITWRLKNLLLKKKKQLVNGKIKEEVKKKKL